ncbi:MAG: carboxypeptidase-like regulatory domain-containing protein [Mangrovibacterium sp.]
MKKLLLSVVLISLTVLVRAGSEKNKTEVRAQDSQLTTISGQVLDQRTNETLAGVKLTLNETGEVTYTDLDGNYQFKNIKPGKYGLTASFISYEKSTVNNFELNKTSNRVNILLKDGN